jgi:hypothetical protein
MSKFMKELKSILKNGVSIMVILLAWGLLTNHCSVSVPSTTLVSYHGERTARYNNRADKQSANSVEILQPFGSQSTALLPTTY